MTTETRHPNGKKGGPTANVVKFPAISGQLAQKFIEPGKTFDEALSNTRITGPNSQQFLRDIVLLHSKMERWNKRHLFDNEIESLVSLLNGIRSIDGIGMNLAAMTDVDIYYPQGGGIELSKEDKQIYADINKSKRITRGSRYESEDEG